MGQRLLTIIDTDILIDAGRGGKEALDLLKGLKAFRSRFNFLGRSTSGGTPQTDSYESHHRIPRYCHNDGNPRSAE